MPGPHRRASAGALGLLALGALPGALLGPAPAAAAVPERAPPRTWVVSPGGELPTLAAALGRAADGDRVLVRPGVYREPTVRVERAVEIVGEEGAVLDGEGARTLLVVTADGVTIRGLTFRNVGTSYVEDRAAVRFEEVRDCAVLDNRFEDAFFGIYLASVDGCRVEGNELVARGAREAAAGNGIHLWYSRDVRIAGNRIEGHRDGIYFEFVEDSRVEDNVSTRNLRYGLHFMFSDRCVYRRNTFSRNGAGVAVMYTEDVEMTGNRFLANRGNAAFGLLLKDITDSRIVDNLFRENSVALHAEGANRVRVAGNVFDRNGWAVRIMANSLDNVFTKNDFLGNAFDVSTNGRRSFSSFTGNYWDRYRGYDLDRDGVGDVPFRPVTLFSVLVERYEPALALLRSLVVDVLDVAERVLPVLTPEALVDPAPAMGRIS